MMNRKHPPEKIDSAIAAYLEGASQREVKDQFDIPIATLTKHMSQRGIKLSKEQVQERLRRGGKISSYKVKCPPGCSCSRHRSPANKKDFIVLGRKFCQGECGRWRLLLDFHVRRRDADGNPTEWQGRCMACGRRAQRKSELPRRPLTIEEKRARRREMYERWRQDPEWSERNREYQRIYSEGRRRARGIEPRHKMFENRKVEDDTPMVEAKPFVEWYESLNGSQPTTEMLGTALARRVYAARSGEQRKIHLSLVYDVADIVGSPEMPYFLYPDA